jgi:hypothetical protein
MKARRKICRVILVTVLGVLLSLESSATVVVEVELVTMTATSSSSDTPPFSFFNVECIDGEEAKAILKNQNPSLSTQLLQENSNVTMDFREDRVRLFVDRMEGCQDPHDWIGNLHYITVISRRKISKFQWKRKPSSKKKEILIIR